MMEPKAREVPTPSRNSQTSSRASEMKSMDVIGCSPRVLSYSLRVV